MTTITSNSTVGIYLSLPSYTNAVVINPGVTISNIGNGISASPTAWTIQNYGSIAGSPTSGVGIYLSAGGSVTNHSSGSISGFTGIYDSQALSVVNDGSIVGPLGGGIVLNSGGLVDNVSSSSIILGIDGVEINGNAGTVVNDGSIAGTGIANGFGFGVALFAGGSVTNAASASITGAEGGIVIQGGAGTVVNDGNITGAGSGVLYAGVVLAAGGAVTNATSASITGGTFGVYIYGGGTLTNAGMVVGNTGTAVAFGGTGSNLLLLDPGYGLSGLAIGGTSASNTLELASAASAGTLSGLGTEFVDFVQTTIDADASWVFNGANTIEAGTTLTELSGATVTVSGTLVNEGSIAIDPSTLTAGGLTGTGVVTIDAGSMFEVQGTVASGETVMFDGSGAYLHLDTPASVAGSVTNFDVGETIDLNGVNPASVSYSDGLLSFSGGNFALSLTNPGSVIASASGDGAAVSVLCFCANALILTPSGERPVQELAVGDTVMTHRGTARRIVWVGTGKVLATRGRRDAATPVIVHRGALADNVPNRDLRVTKGHSLYIDDVLIPVEFLVNHRSIFWDDNAQEIELYHIELETHDVLVANGAAAESYRDDGNRWLFRNANNGWNLPPQAPYAPVLTGGVVVDAAWRRLLERAGPWPGVPMTDDPDLHLLVDGQRVNPASRSNVWHVFRLPAPPAAVRIVSRSGVPQEIGLARDPRCLGVALQQIIVTRGAQTRTIEAEDAVLTDGFHGYEGDNDIRWTDGDAAVPAGLFEGLAGPLEVALRLGCKTSYLDEGTILRAA
jgi:aspartate 1-decarboxylase